MLALALPSLVRSSLNTMYWLPAPKVSAPDAIDPVQFTPSTVASGMEVFEGVPLFRVSRLAVTVSAAASPLVTAEKLIWFWLVPSSLRTIELGDAETLTNSGGATPMMLPSTGLRSELCWDTWWPPTTSVQFTNTARRFFVWSESPHTTYRCTV